MFLQSLFAFWPPFDHYCAVAPQNAEKACCDNRQQVFSCFGGKCAEPIKFTFHRQSIPPCRSSPTRKARGSNPFGRTKKTHCNVLLQCAFWFDVILVSESLPAFREDDFVDKEENDHRHTAVQNRRADVINKVRHQQPGYGNPYAVDGVDDAGDDAESQHIPRDLLA